MFLVVELSADWSEAVSVQRPLPNHSLKAVAREKMKKMTTNSIAPIDVGVTKFLAA